MNMENTTSNEFTHPIYFITENEKEVEKINTINVIVLGKNRQDGILDVSRFENSGQDIPQKKEKCFRYINSR